MRLSLSEFCNITKNIQAARKCVSSAEVSFDYCYVNGTTQYNFIYSSLKFRNVTKLHEFMSLRDISTSHVGVRGLVIGAKNDAVGEDLDIFDDTSELVDRLNSNTTTKSLTGSTPEEKQHLRILPSVLSMEYRPLFMLHAPVEVVEGDHTYRLVSSGHRLLGKAIELVAREDEPLYNYLDKNFLIKIIQQKHDKYVVVSNQYDVNTAHVFALVSLQPSLAEFLRDGCFLDYREAELIRLKMTKKLDEQHKEEFKLICSAIDKDYRENTTLIAVSKVVDGAIEKTTLNNIVFTRISAVYEDRIKVEHPELLEILATRLDFNGEYDIYAVIDKLAKKLEYDLNQQNVEDQKISLKINDIPIELSRNSKSGARQINGIRINMDEIAQALQRAACYHDANKYNLFLKSISRMSIRWHDVVANGLPVKIHSTIVQSEYRDEDPGPNAPALKFALDGDKNICLQIDRDRKIRIQMRKLLGKVKTLNKKTNGSYSYRIYPSQLRDYRWCTRQLIDVLIEATTYPKENGEQECLITREDVTKLLESANEAKIKALERSKEFLASVVKLTNAEEIEFNGNRAYKVKGNLRTYAVVIKTAKVYDYDSKQYRCIVNDRHYAGAGYDDIAARLLALKNDSMMQDSIGTLRGAANPGAENVHDYEPEREENVSVQSIVEEAFK